jgi:hypothetical protein
VEILWEARVDRDLRATYGYKVSRTAGSALVVVPDWTEFAPLRRNAIRFFENSVERASRERTDSGISPKRSHKIGHFAS